VADSGLVVLSYITLPAVGSAEAPSGYDEHDYEKLKAFLELANEAGTNGSKLSAGYDPDNPDTWAGVTWSDSTPKRVTHINWAPMGLIGNLDVSGCTELKSLDCENNHLDSLNVSNCTALESLNCYHNRLTSLHASNCTALQSLDCYDNQLSTLDLSNCTALNLLDCQNNQLSNLDVSTCAALTSLKCSNNRLASLDVSNCTALRDLSCRYNQLTFANLPRTLPVAGGQYLYAPQADIVIGSAGAILAGEEIDLSAQARVGEVDTVFSWYNSEGIEVTPTTASGGKFTFGGEFGGQTIYCRMTNSALPDLTLDTTDVFVELGPLQIVFIKPTAANDESNPANISSGSLVIARIDGDISAVSSVTISLDDGEKQQAVVAGGMVCHLLPAGLDDGGHTVTIELTMGDGTKISESVTFHWTSRRRGFGFGRFDFGNVDEP